ncbi:MAG: branched-chain-amino-acid transaminase [Candidatus Omnitrophica bacterium]|nr:branched-chain-amino-acid transaminase [Candidatus Omnitrophota bacterium]
MKVYIDGKWVPEKDARVSVFDHGLLYGDGVFEGIRSYNSHVFKLNEHIDRLYESANSIMLKIPLSKPAMRRAVIQTLKINHLENAYIRLVVTRGKGDLGLDPRKCRRATTIIITDRIKLYPKALYENGLSLITVPTQRNIPEALNPQIKSLNYLNNILAKIEANLAGAVEAIMLTAQGYVAECTGENIFIIKKGELYTPPCWLGALRGITREAIILIARRLRIPCAEQVLTRHDLFNAHEMFLTGTAAEVVPVVQVDGRSIGTGRPGPVTGLLRREFRRMTQTEGVPIK